MLNCTSSRRSFLLSVVAGATAGGVGSFLWEKQSRLSGVRYCVPAPETSDLVKPFDYHTTAMPQKILYREVSGFNDKYRSLISVVDGTSCNLRRIYVPGYHHSGVFIDDKIFMVTRGEPGLLVVLDPQTLEVISARRPPDDFLFGGHLISVDGGGVVAVTLNSPKRGAYDSIGYFDSKTLKEIHRHSSFGFQAHELTLGANAKNLYVGHYGSNYKSGPYRDLVSPILVRKGAEKMPVAQQEFYPGCVCVIDMKESKLIECKSDNQNGPQGHLAISRAGQIFLTKARPFMHSRGDEKVNFAFREGVDGKQVFSQFLDLGRVAGTSILVDPLYNQFILVDTNETNVVWGLTNSRSKLNKVNLQIDPLMGLPHGLQFHPDGEHYIVSCENGFYVFKRNSHEYVPDKSFRTFLGNHSHFCVG